MSKWENFEVECTNFLNEQFGKYAKFYHQGGSNSTIPDIEVLTNKNKKFFIEAKQSPAQCGQFVLLPSIKDKKFDYSKLNITKLNSYSQQIIDYMNKNFEEFKEAGTSGKDIIFPNSENIFINWIINTYKEKNVKFFITNNYVILPIEKFSEYFKVKAKYRVKRSGSSSVGNSYIEKVKTFITSLDLVIDNFKIDKDKLFVFSKTNLDKNKFVLNGVEYMFSNRDDAYEIRRLSNTFNANVIFSIELKTNKQGISISDFIFVLVE